MCNTMRVICFCYTKKPCDRESSVASALLGDVGSMDGQLQRPSGWVRSVPFLSSVRESVSP